MIALKMLDDVAETRNLGEGASGRAAAWRLIIGENLEEFDQIACKHCIWNSPQSDRRISSHGLHDDLARSEPLDNLPDDHPRAGMYLAIASDPEFVAMVRAWVQKTRSCK
jgi:hypothetical protein